MPLKILTFIGVWCIPYMLICISFTQALILANVGVGPLHPCGIYYPKRFLCLPLVIAISICGSHLSHTLATLYIAKWYVKPKGCLQPRSHENWAQGWNGIQMGDLCNTWVSDTPFHLWDTQSYRGYLGELDIFNQYWCRPACPHPFMVFMFGRRQ